MKTAGAPRIGAEGLLEQPDEGVLGRRGERLFWMAVAAALVLRVVGMWRIGLIPEEAYYWMYGRHPSLSYFDHPAMVAWIIQLGTAVFGNTPFGVRVVSDLLMLGASGVMYCFARQWWDRRSAVWAALSLQVLPVYYGVGFTGMMDGALIFWWLVCLLGISLAVRRKGAGWWYLAGLGFGGAMQSKYSAVFLAPGALILLAGHRPYRRWLKSIHAWLGLALGVALFTPTILWNAQHDWASFRFQFLSRSDADHISAATVLAFVGFQLAILTPLAVVGAVWALKRLGWKKRRWSGRWVMAWAFCLPLVAALGWKSLREAHLNWTVPAWLSLLPALAHLLHARMRLRRRQRSGGFDWRPGMAITAWACVAINIGLVAYFLVLQPVIRKPDAFGPWGPVAQAVQKQVDQLELQTGRPVLVIAQGKYRLASVLAFYRLPLEAGADQRTTSQWVFGGSGLGYPYWLDLQAWIGRDCIFVTQDRDELKAAGRFFDRMAPPAVFDERGEGTYYIARGYGLRR